MEILTETTANPPYLLGNFPRLEIVFDCIDNTGAKPAVSGSDNSKYRRLLDLKKLLDAGVLTQQEFDSEKAKVLAEP